MGIAMFRRGKNRVIVLGLDGSPYTVVKKLVADDVMPNFAFLTNEGNFYQMDTTIPEISSVAWSSFMTGKNPGEHGIYGFTNLVPSSYKLRFPNFFDLKASPIWKDLEKLGKRTVVINLPSTYPAKPINGILIAGFVALRLESATYPEKIIPVLRSMGYRIDVDTLKGREDKNFLIKDLFETLRIRKQAIEYFWNKERWDLFIAVVTGTDRLQHFLMDAFFDNTHKYHQSFLDYYHLIDEEIIRWIRKRLDDRTKFIMLSDHGFTEIEKEVYLNRWLFEKGYLKFKDKAPETIEDIAEGSKVFVLDPGRFYINLKGVYPMGTISKGDEYENLVEELMDKIKQIEYRGKKVVKSIFRKEEVYNGPYLGDAPDIIAVSNYGFDLKGSVKSTEIFGNTILQGMHTQDDAFLLLPADVTLPDKPHIVQLRDVIFRLMQ